MNSGSLVISDLILPVYQLFWQARLVINALNRRRPPSVMEKRRSRI
jgi:hypothetical protein